MDIQATKLELIKQLLAVKKESVLNKVKEILSTELQETDEIVAYTVDGKPLDRTAYKAKVQEGLDDIEAGKFTFDEDLEKEIETW